MSNINIVSGMGADSGLNEGQNANFTTVMRAGYEPTDTFRKEVVSKKLGRPEMLDYESGNGWGKQYLMSKYFTQEENKKQFDTPETTLKYLNSVTLGKNAALVPNKDRLQQADDFLVNVVDNQKDPTEFSFQLQTFLGVPANGVVGPEGAKAIANYLTLYSEEELTKKALATKYAPETEVKNKIISELYEEFVISEGNGDTTGAAPTGERGLTDAVYAALKKKHGADLTQEQASKQYLTDIHDSFSKNLVGFDKLGEATQKGILDAAYNLNYQQMLKFKGFTTAVKNNNPEEIFKSLLDTANTDRQSIKGLAKRRAAAYNTVVPDSKITSVKQDADGTISYLKNNKVYFTYKPSGGKHAKSTAGIIKV